MVIEGLTQSNRAPPAHLGVFAAATLILSWGISFVVIGETIPWYTTVLIMFSPAVVVLSIRRATGHSILRTILSSLRGTTWVSLGFAIIYPVVFIGAAALLALTTGLGTYQPGADNVLREIIAANGVLLPIWVVLNLIIVYGEELGWRGYLLRSSRIGGVGSERRALSASSGDCIMPPFSTTPVWPSVWQTHC